MGLEKLLQENNINPKDINTLDLGKKVSVINLPEDLSEYPSAKRTNLFIGFILPHIEKSNDIILSRRKKLIRYILDKNAGKPVDKSREQWLTGLAHLYNGANLPAEKLLHRVDIVPPSLALAQAVNESGWGTSRFARQGSALFGQHLAANSSEMYITSLYGNVKVAAFNSIFAATSSYIYNLNTSKTYKTLRDIRGRQRAEGKIPVGRSLAEGLHLYSEIGYTYVNDIRYLMNRYELHRFDPTQGNRKTVPSTAVIFTRKTPLATVFQARLSEYNAHHT